MVGTTGIVFNLVSMGKCLFDTLPMLLQVIPWRSIQQIGLDQVPCVKITWLGRFSHCLLPDLFTTCVLSIFSIFKYYWIFLSDSFFFRGGVGGHKCGPKRISQRRRGILLFGAWAVSKNSSYSLWFAANSSIKTLRYTIENIVSSSTW